MSMIRRGNASNGRRRLVTAVASNLPVWSDEFTGSAINMITSDSASDPGVWRPSGGDGGLSYNQGYKDYAGSSWNIAPAQHPAYNPFSVSNSVLTVTVQRNPGTLAGVDASCAWLSGYLVTNAKQNLAWKYGYYEWRAAMPEPIRGMFPALWLYNESSSPARAELDIMEIFGNPSGQPWASSTHIHYNNNVGSGSDSGAQPLYQASDDTAGWHRYGLDWTAQHVAVYKDGVMVAEVTDPTQVAYFGTATMTVRIDYVMDPTFVDSARVSTSTDPAVGTKSRLLVDYVRRFATIPNPLPTGTADPLNMGGPTTIPAASF